MTAPFLEARISNHITQGAHGGPSVPGRVKTYRPGGQLFQSFESTMPIHKYDISHGVRNRDDFQTVIDLFYVVFFGDGGPYVGFRYKDWRDFRGTKANTGLTQPSSNVYQLQRIHRFGSASFSRPIFKPVQGTVQLWDVTDTLVPAVVDYTTGLAVTNSSLLHPTYWTGEFDVPVTFTDDEWTSDLEIANDDIAWMTSSSIKLEEVRF